MKSMNRRTALSRIGMLTSLGTGVRWDKLSYVTDRDKKRRVLAYRHQNHDEMKNGASPEREPVFYEIPRSDWVNIEATHNASKGLNKRFSDPQISFGVERDATSHVNQAITANWITTEKADGSERSPDLPFKQFKDKVPNQAKGKVSDNKSEETVENIPIKINKETQTEQGLYNSKYRPVPGGCQMSGGGSTCTLAAPAYDQDSFEYVHTTAAHCINRTNGTVVHQDAKFKSNSKIGESEKYTPYGDGDAATIKLNDTNETFKIAGKNGDYDYPVRGSLSNDRLKDMAYSDLLITKQGRTTGRDTVEVLEFRSKATRDMVVIDYVTEGGDSGGPYYEIDYNSEAYIGAIHKGRNSDGKAIGTTAQHAEEYLNITF